MGHPLLDLYIKPYEPPSFDSFSQHDKATLKPAFKLVPPGVCPKCGNPLAIHTVDYGYAMLEQDGSPTHKCGQCSTMVECVNPECSYQSEDYYYTKYGFRHIPRYIADLIPNMERYLLDSFIDNKENPFLLHGENRDE